MNQTSTKDIFARILGIVAIVLAVVGLVLLSVSGAGQAGQTAGGIGGKTATEGTYIAFGGFGIGTEQSFKQVFNSSGQLVLSTTGTPITRLNTGTCFIQPYATTIAASSTAQVDCQATAATGGVTTVNDTPLLGVTYGDNVVATLGTSTAGITVEGLDLIAAQASSTPGILTFVLANGTGKTFTWPTTGSASGTASYVATH